VFQPDGSELDKIGLLPLLGVSAVKEIARRGDDNEILILALLHECLNGWKSGLGLTAKNKIAPVVFSQIFDERITGKSTVKEKHAIGRDMRQKALNLVALGVMDRAYCPGNRQLSKDVVGGHDKALGVVALAAIIETAFGVEFGADLLGCGKYELGAVEGIYGHPVPQARVIMRPKAVRQSNSPAQDLLENGPGHLSPCAGNVAAVGRIGVMPKTTASGTAEKLGQLDIYAFAHPARDKGENKDDQLGECKFAVTGEMGIRQL